MSEFYDRNGAPMSLEDWARKIGDRDYKRVAETTTPSGHWVSTVWFGLDHSFGDATPLIFETMVFPPRKDGEKRSSSELDARRYSTEEDAKAGHAEMVAKWSKP